MDRAERISNSIEELKAEGDYRLAGRLAYALRRERIYGCHYGLRITRDQSAAEFYLGWDEQEERAHGQG